MSWYGGRGCPVGTHYASTGPRIEGLRDGTRAPMYRNRDYSDRNKDTLHRIGNGSFVRDGPLSVPRGPFPVRGQGKPVLLDRETCVGPASRAARCPDRVDATPGLPQPVKGRRCGLTPRHRLGRGLGRIVSSVPGAPRRPCALARSVCLGRTWPQSTLPGPAGAINGTKP